MTWAENRLIGQREDVISNMSKCSGVGIRRVTFTNGACENAISDNANGLNEPSNEIGSGWCEMA